jgi:hypothetical protein
MITVGPVASYDFLDGIAKVLGHRQLAHDFVPMHPSYRLLFVAWMAFPYQ